MPRAAITRLQPAKKSHPASERKESLIIVTDLLGDHLSRRERARRELLRAGKPVNSPSQAKSSGSSYSSFEAGGAWFMRCCMRAWCVASICLSCVC